MVERSFRVESCPASVTGSCSLSDILMGLYIFRVNFEEIKRVEMGGGILRNDSE